MDQCLYFLPFHYRDLNGHYLSVHVLDIFHFVTMFHFVTIFDLCLYGTDTRANITFLFVFFYVLLSVTYILGFVFILRGTGPR